MLGFGALAWGGYQLREEAQRVVESLPQAAERAREFVKRSLGDVGVQAGNRCPSRGQIRFSRSHRHDGRRARRLGRDARTAVTRSTGTPCGLAESGRCVRSGTSSGGFPLRGGSSSDARGFRLQAEDAFGVKYQHSWQRNFPAKLWGSWKRGASWA